MTLTNLERRVIQGILDSDYMDGETAWPAVGKHVWTWSANPFTITRDEAVTPNFRKYAGVISSLVKKGYVVSVEDGEDSTVRLTEEGWKAFQPWSQHYTME